ncbi:MAG: 16S rRNA (guanine(966)-N(2))-methyltransferase RsmD [Candidatus Lumbricidophila eiseniae]|uniref:16S rRNA (Guanine(966)-N(2))-methyltransferase RsmD n=1 Tax=Candidatus Lumbricidiphila eiseniae TaxID=1969409 RepID=A0A2A6FT19_9MICO|nr:MAG: 16S rRNA (guanine(966)-N(2))-methyltransferase RsmD [Candidatus Lumbricidophila eiseniae]
MTRIISGFARSLALRVPTSGTRPTSDRVREAIFSSLTSRIDLTATHVLDLYAGSGALGLEAASRGATTVTLVEKARLAADICRRNADAVRDASRGAAAPPAIRVITKAVTAFLTQAQSETTPLTPRVTGVDVVFFDPPYELLDSALARELALLVPLLNDDALVIVERSSRSPEPSWPRGIRLDNRRDYGDTTCWWALAEGAIESHRDPAHVTSAPGK